MFQQFIDNFKVTWGTNYLLHRNRSIAGLPLRGQKLEDKKIEDFEDITYTYIYIVFLS